MSTLEFSLSLAMSAIVSVAVEKMGGMLDHPIGNTSGNATSGSSPDYSTTSMRRMTWYPSREEQFCVVLARMLDPVQPAKLDKALQVSITAQNISVRSI